MNKVIMAIAVIVIIAAAAFYLVSSRQLPQNQTTGAGITGASAQTAAQNTVQQEMDSALASSSQSIESALVNQ